MVYLALPNVVFRPTLEALAERRLRRGGRPSPSRSRSAPTSPTRRRPERPDRPARRRRTQVFRIDHFLGQADRAQHPRAALRQPDLRAGVEQRPRRRGRHRLRRDPGPGGPGRLLRPRGRAARHDPEPPAAGAGARRDGAPATLGGRADLRDRKADVLRAVRSATDDAVATAARARYTAGSVGGRELPAYVDEEGVDPGPQDRDLRRGHGAPSTTGGGPACRSGCARARRWAPTGRRSC